LALASQQDLSVVADATQDNRLKLSPLVLDEPHVRFFASKLLVSENGETMGSLCIFDSKPRQLSELQLNALSHLANVASQLTEHWPPVPQGLPLADQNAQIRESKHEELIDAFEIADLKSTVGELAVGSAVKLNQPLMAILGYADVAESMLEHDSFDGQEELSRYIKKITEESIRAGELIRDLRFSLKNDTGASSIFDLKTLILKSIEMVDSEASKYDINVLTDFVNSSKANTHINGNEVQLAQVLLNLLRNSINAIAVDKPGFSKIIVVRTEVVNGEIVCSIHDNGSGMEQQFQDYDDDTLDMSNRSSVRLSICRSVVEAHGGQIWQASKSEFSPGTSLYFSLPI